MRSSLLVRAIGFPALLIHGDTTVLDRWLWLRARLTRLIATGARPRLIDVGCGSGAFTIGAARMGFDALGLSWDAENQAVAAERAGIVGVAARAAFRVCDVRRLDAEADLFGQFDVAVSCENIEHVLDDRKLMRDMARTLKPGGVLLLTTPNVEYRPIDPAGIGDAGALSLVEDGGHVRRGYDEATLAALCDDAGLEVERFSGVSGVVSQRVTGLQHAIIRHANARAAWLAVLPLRALPPLVDAWATRAAQWPYYSLGLEARKPR